MSTVHGESLGRRGAGWSPAASGWRALLVWVCAALLMGLLGLAVWVSLPSALRQLPGSLGADQAADYASNSSSRFAPQRPAGSAGSAAQTNR